MKCQENVQRKSCQLSRPCLHVNISRPSKCTAFSTILSKVLAQRKSGKLTVVNTSSVAMDSSNAQPESNVLPNYSEAVASEAQVNEWMDMFQIDSSEQSCVKIAVQGRQVGAILGMGGQRCQALQDTYGVKIFVTMNGDFIPTTRQRLLQISGQVGSCLMALSDLLGDIAQPIMTEDNQLSEETKRLTVLFPIQVVGKIFKDSGTQVKNLQHVTGANIAGQSVDQMVPMQDVRKFDITGSLSEILQTYTGLLAICLMDSVYKEFSAQLPTVHTDTQWLPRYLSTLPRNAALMKGSYTVELGFPEAFMPILIGKGGSNLQRLLQMSGNGQINIPRDEFIEGTDLRKVILKGSFREVIRVQAGLDRLIRDSIRSGQMMPIQFEVPVFSNNNR